MSNFEVKYDLPIPASRRQVYSFHEMDVNGHFHVPEREAKQMQSATTAAGKRLGAKFITRNVADIPGCKYKTGCVVWRVE